ncbi:hypothetical protein RJT34_04873 [Clitoria ternatea]|uniref:Uncharacterized protein n=1 Tax=Clitoria ternatea TaxID=43366 RepID=A0AAN9KQI3_CLITE
MKQDLLDFHVTGQLHLDKRQNGFQDQRRQALQGRLHHCCWGPCNADMDDWLVSSRELQLNNLRLRVYISEMKIHEHKIINSRGAQKYKIKSTTDKLPIDIKKGF